MLYNVNKARYLILLPVNTVGDCSHSKFVSCACGQAQNSS